MNIVGVIPARYKSSRFEGKPLVLIDGVAMIERTYKRALKSSSLNELVVATEDERIYNFCQNQRIPVFMTSSSCLTGTDRVAEVARHISADLYVNIQGDEPVIDSRCIDEIVEEYKLYGDDYIAYNLYKQTEEAEAKRESIIKVVTNCNEELVYMSRSIIPHRKVSGAVYKKQVCVYGFSKNALELFSQKNKTYNEKLEDIEILRFLDLGYKIKMKETRFSSISVDIPEDIAKVEDFLRSRFVD